MSRPAHLFLLILISALLFAGLSRLDTDPAADSVGQQIAMFLLVTVVVGILYAGIYGLLRELRQRRARQ